MKKPKTPAARRRIELPQVAVDALLTHRAAMVREDNAAAPAVFCNRKGGFIHGNNLDKDSFKPLAVR